MHVLVIGASGFIGSHVTGRLLAEGFRVTIAGRAPARLARTWPEAAVLACDFAHDDVSAWTSRLRGVDAVVNCAGLIGNRADYAGVHDSGPRALFDACMVSGVERVIQISALGADDTGVTRYHRSKKNADDHLAALDPDGRRMGWAVLRPSLVLGRGGASMALFATLAALPIMPRLGEGSWQVQPVYIDDLVEAALRLLHRPGLIALKLDAVGPCAVTTDELIQGLRRWLGLRPAPPLALPMRFLSLVARFGVGPVTRESLSMLVAGNTAAVAPFAHATGLHPMALDEMLARHPACAADLVEARLQAFAPALPILLALVWLAGGVVLLAFAPAVAVSTWLAKVGLVGLPASVALWSGSLADIAIGLALLARVRGAALAGTALMLGYTVILTLAAPDVWADPFGPLVKNLAVLGLSLVVHAMEARRG
ncbi:Nucleoside-diphosphate-sugar epimerase [Novosphingobium sp. CF614]|uniref:SDR family oxidoreductase n=1 Tax=Novosphingobium sp. CF614 TaxID=1884364 RepID=UPI0008EB3679|nr:SDR family oxidoreductase [Novosphingobium sp. CF614]SFG38550.1 Nucleoside-diphosphate-sugar epimerase [Novosphingobium sp. CF614]